MPRIPLHVLASFWSVGLLAISSEALAALSKEQCIAANTEVQSLRRAEKLSKAREALKVCLDPECPALVRSDCSERLEEIERVQPTIVFDLKDAAGRDVSAVRVTIDGQMFTDDLNGAALPVDPGPHEFLFQVAGAAPLERNFVIKESEKLRRERIEFEPIPKPAVADLGAPRAASLAANDARNEPAPESAPGRPWKTLGLVAGGAGVAGVIVATVFGLKARSASNAQKAACSSSSCNDSDRARARSEHSKAAEDATVADIAFAGGGLLIAGGAVLFFVAPSAAPAPTRRGLLMAPSLSKAGGALTLSGTFD